MAQTLTQDDLDAIVAAINSAKPFVTLADGVAHGGTPGSSTATLALLNLCLDNPNGDAFDVISGSADGIGIYVEGAFPVWMHGTSAAPGPAPAVTIESSYGPAVQMAVLAGNFDCVTFAAAGSGKHDINLAGSGTINGDFAAFTESYAADGATGKLSQLLYQILSIVSEFSISGTTITCKKLDGSTTAMTFTLDSSSAPTSRTRAT